MDIQSLEESEEQHARQGTLPPLENPSPSEVGKGAKQVWGAFNKAKVVPMSSSINGKKWRQGLNSQKSTSVIKEVIKRANNLTLIERDTDAVFTLADKMIYLGENYLASAPGGSLNILLLITGVAMVGMSILWAIVMNLGAVDEQHRSEPNPPWHNIHLYIFYTFQIFASGGYDTAVGYDAKWSDLHLSTNFYVVMARVVYITSLIIGLVIFAVLVGIITAGFEAILEGIEEGRSKVMETNHTLILGWNEGTIRVIIQIAFLRALWRKQNDTFFRRLFPWLRVPPASPVASNTVVIMCNRLDGDGNERSKIDIDNVLKEHLAARGISAIHTRVGLHIIVRMGDPTSVHDLVRVNAPRATSILTMMTDEDEREAKSSGGKVLNGATIRTLLALRSVMCADDTIVKSFDERDVRLVTQLMEYSPYIEAACFRSATGRRLVEPLELSVFVNNLMFSCAAKSLLSHLYMKVLNFETTAMRCRLADQVRGGPHGALGYLVGKTVQEAQYQHLWESCLLIGITNEDVLMKDADFMEGDNGEIIGFCAQPNYVIKSNDLLIFIGATSNPEVLDAPLLAPASELEDAGLDITPFDRRQLIVDMCETRRILIIGWRWVWTRDENRLKNRIYEIARSAGPGTYIVFMNQMATEDDSINFKENLERTGVVKPIFPGDGGDGGTKILPGCTAGWRLTEYPHVRVFHAERKNASKYEDLLPVMETRFDSAIVLGTQATAEQLEPQSQDTRVLSMLLCIKHVTVDSEDRPDVWKNANIPPLHIVSENEIDQTAEVAVVPSGSGKDPDFINTQAITARALVLALAFPAMQPAVRELFDDKHDADGSPIFDIVPCPILGLSGQRLHFSEINRLVNLKFRGWATALGFMEHDKLYLAPGINDYRSYTSDMKVIIIQRHFKPAYNPPV